MVGGIRRMAAIRIRQGLIRAESRIAFRLPTEPANQRTNRGFTERTRTRPLSLFYDYLSFISRVRPVSSKRQCATRRGFSAQPRCCWVAGWRSSPPTRGRCTPVRSTIRRCRRPTRRTTARCPSRRIIAARARVLAVPLLKRGSQPRPRSCRRASLPLSSRSSRSRYARTPPTSSSSFPPPSDRRPSSVDAHAAAPLGRRGCLSRWPFAALTWRLWALGREQTERRRAHVLPKIR